MKGNAMALKSNVTRGGITVMGRPAQSTGSTGLTGSAGRTENSRADMKYAYLELLTPVKKHLYNFIRKLLNFSPDADDIYQETLLKAFRYFHSFKEGKSFKTWIFTIAHNLAKDYFKSRTPVSLDDVENLPLDFEGPVPAEVQDIYHEAARLKPRQREVFFLYYYNEFKVPEIVDITGLSVPNVKYALRQARETLKQQLEVRS